MKRKVKIFLEPIEKEIDLPDNLITDDEIEQEIDNIIYNEDIEDVIISYWE